MITVRRDEEIFRKDGGWFSARWHFSFGEYRDPEQMGFGNLRVFNDDRLVPGAVWPLHPHRDVEGLTYVVEGTFRHEDDHGGDSVLPAGSVQRMTLGSGAWHSEQNASQDEPMRFVQMWIMPEELGLPPSLDQRVFTIEERTDRLLRAIAPEGGDAVKVHGNAVLYVSRLTPGTEVKHELDGDRTGSYVYVIEGDLGLNGERLGTGDAAKVADEGSLALRAEDETELMVIEVDLTWQSRRDR